MREGASLRRLKTGMAEGASLTRIKASMREGASSLGLLLARAMLLGSAYLLACLPAYLPAHLLACLPAYLPAHLLACLPAYPIVPADG